MPIWILTIGNSDVQLRKDELWTQFYDAVINSEQDSPEKKLLMLLNRDKKERRLRGKDSKTDCFPAPPRVLGLLYRGDRFERGKGELAFPLLKTFCEKFDPSSAPSRVIVLLTDQSELFSKRDRKQNDCPFWQDTCELREIIEYYFKQLEADKKIRIETQFAYIKPHNGKGIDNWNEMLDAVSQTLDGIDELKPGLTGETIYVSHQAGTPAISSAVQFASISKFPEVKFLVSNQSYDGEIQSSPEIIKSSKYWRGLQIQKAKKLILRGEPGAALELVREIENKAKVSETIARKAEGGTTEDTMEDTIEKKLEKMVACFNIKAEDEDKGDSKIVKPKFEKGDPSEFKPEAAAKRIKDALDLIEILFENGKYALGIALLAAALETYMKAAIVKQIYKLTTTIAGIDLSNAIEWDNSGLHLKSQDYLEKILASDEKAFLKLDRELEEKIKFPSSQIYKYQGYRRREPEKNYIINNTTAFNWLKNIAEDAGWFNWPLLKWISLYYRDRELDFRNQLMHNLRGVEKSDVIQYLQGHPKKKGKIDNTEEVVDVYKTKVKIPFVQALKGMELLPKGESTENKLRQDLAELAAELDKVAEPDKTAKPEKAN